jgi:outer membrane protein OmpA-like peptidoglycan-associated protein
MKPRSGVLRMAEVLSRLAGGKARVAMLALVAAWSTGCTHTVIVSHAANEMDRARSGPDVKDAATLAPQELAHAEEERSLSLKAGAAGDPESADLYAERAVVAYDRAVVLARLARATDAETLARTKLAEEEASVQRVAAAKVTFENEANGLLNELAVAREALASAHVGPADPARERARLEAARSLEAEAHLLCGAARLLAREMTPPLGADDTALLTKAEHDDASVEASLAKPPRPHAATPIDAAANARVGCLAVLTRARRVSGAAGTGEADALLSALSSHGGWTPSRDERGVVVTLRGAFKGTTLVPDAERTLRELGHVASANPAFPVQIVVHDATPPTEHDKASDAQRANAALAALTAGGAAAGQMTSETIGARLPTSDPNDPTARVHNARLEVVFVSRGD